MTGELVLNNRIDSEASESILQAKLDTRIEEMRQKASGPLGKVINDGELLKDMIVHVGPINGGRLMTFKGNGRVNARIQDEDYHLHPHAVYQAAEKLGIPPTYARQMAQGAEWERLAIAGLLNIHASNIPNRQRVLVRSIGDEIRGVLSDTYRRLSSPNILASFFRTAKEFGAVVIDAMADETRWSVEIITPRVIMVPTAKNGTTGIAIGARLSSSDFGDGALDMRAFIMQAICINGAVGSSMIRQVHLGGRIPDDLEVSRRTFELDSKAQASLVGDIVRNALSPHTETGIIGKIKAAAGTPVDLDGEIKKLPRQGVSKAEVEEITGFLTRSLPEDGLQGEGTRWKLGQAVGCLANKVETDNPRRARELHEIAGSIILN